MSRFWWRDSSGLVIGIERELDGHEAGDRTFSLVTMGAALFTALSFEAFGGSGADGPSRVAANIVTGIGFLGAGMIIRDRTSIRGLTTSAAIWAIATFEGRIEIRFEEFTLSSHGIRLRPS